MNVNLFCFNICRFVVGGRAMKASVVSGSAKAFNYQKAFNLPFSEVRKWMLIKEVTINSGLFVFWVTYIRFWDVPIFCLNQCLLTCYTRIIPEHVHIIGGWKSWKTWKLELLTSQNVTPRNQLHLTKSLQSVMSWIISASQNPQKHTGLICHRKS